MIACKKIDEVKIKDNLFLDNLRVVNRESISYDTYYTNWLRWKKLHDIWGALDVCL